MSSKKSNGIGTAEAWRAAGQAARESRAEPLRLPSGITILAIKPEPLDWIISGRLPQKLLSAVVESGDGRAADPPTELSREEILELAEFATCLVKASIARPRLGEGPGEMRLEDIPVEDRAFIFRWACRALEQPSPASNTTSGEEVLSSAALERFRQK